MVGLHIALRPGGGRLRAVAPQVLFPLLGEIPHGQEGYCHGPYCVALQPDGVVLPVAEPGLDVDVLVRHIDAPSKGHPAVHNHIFPVVPVVLAQGDNRHHPVKHPALNPQFFQPAWIVCRQSEDGPHVIIDDTDLHSLLHLLLEHLEHRVPELPLLDDKVFDEHILPGALDGCQQIPVAVVSQRIIGRPGISIDRTVHLFLQIVGDPSGIRSLELGKHVRAATVPSQILANLSLHCLEPPLVILGQSVPSQQEIGHRAQRREHEHNDNPAYLVARIAPVPCNPQGHQSGKEVQRPTEQTIIGTAAQNGKHHNIKPDLQENHHCDDPDAVEQQPGQLGQQLSQHTQRFGHGLPPSPRELSLAGRSSSFQHNILLAQYFPQLPQQGLVVLTIGV